jgi:hypothetical protein
MDLPIGKKQLNTKCTMQRISKSFVTMHQKGISVINVRIQATQHKRYTDREMGSTNFPTATNTTVAGMGCTS